MVTADSVGRRLYRPLTRRAFPWPPAARYCRVDANSASRFRQGDNKLAGVPDRDPVIVVGSGIAGGLLALAAAETGPVVARHEGGPRRRAAPAAPRAGSPRRSTRRHGRGARRRHPRRRRRALRRRGGRPDLRGRARPRSRPCCAGASRFDLDPRGGLRAGARGRALRARASSTPAATRPGRTSSPPSPAPCARDPRVEIAEGETALEVVVRDGRACGLRTPHGRRARDRARGPARSRWPPAARATSTRARRTRSAPRPTAPPWPPAPAPPSPTSSSSSSTPPPSPSGDGPLGLVSEAVRGEGAILRDAEGQRFMPDEHPMAELGPRDVVARAIDRRARRRGRAT